MPVVVRSISFSNASICCNWLALNSAKGKKWFINDGCSLFPPLLAYLNECLKRFEDRRKWDAVKKWKDTFLRKKWKLEASEISRGKEKVIENRKRGKKQRHTVYWPFWLLKKTSRRRGGHVRGTCIHSIRDVHCMCSNWRSMIKLMLVLAWFYVFD